MFRSGGGGAQRPAGPDEDRVAYDFRCLSAIPDALGGPTNGPAAQFGLEVCPAPDLVLEEPLVFDVALPPRRRARAGRPFVRAEVVV